MFRSVLYVMICLLFYSCLRRPEGHVRLYAPFMQQEDLWIDSALATMTLEEKVGQLILLETDGQFECASDSILGWTDAGMISGLLPVAMPLVEFLDFRDMCLDRSAYPLFFAADGNASFNQLFEGVTRFPDGVSLAAVREDSLKRALHNVMLESYRALGINLVFGPDLDSPFAGYDDFDAADVAKNPAEFFHTTASFMHHLHDRKILSVAKAFKEYHSVSFDSMNNVVKLLQPYYNLVHNGLSGMLVDDEIYAIDTLKFLQTFFLENYLKEHMKFRGLLVSKLSKNATIGEMIHAGTDLFVVNHREVTAVHNYLFDFVKQGLISEKVLNAKVGKILMAKRWAEINPAPAKDVLAKFQQDSHEYLAHTLFEEALTLVHNDQQILPFHKTHQRDFRLVFCGQEEMTDFQKFFSHYATYSSDLLVPDSVGTIPLIAVEEISKQATMILVLDNIDLSENENKVFIDRVNDLMNQNKLVILNFGSPYNLKFFNNKMAFVQLYERNDINEALAAQLLFGAVQAKGQLPVAVGNFPVGHAAAQTDLIRLRDARPEMAGITPHKLIGIDAIIQSAIAAKAFPGCQILVAKSGKIIYNKSFGYHTFRKRKRVNNNDLYDVASVTKIAATTLGAMELYEDKKFGLNDKIKDHLACGPKSRIRNIKLKELFIHQSGLQANMPISKFVFPKRNMDENCNKFYCKERKDNYIISVADSCHMDARWLDSLWVDVYNLRPKRAYRFNYSDVNFNIIQRIIENKVGLHLDTYLNREFYKPLNLRRCMFNPLHKFGKHNIVPTAYDYHWRKQLLCGTVHDESAALMGGVGGNAGLFSNARDLAVIFQLLLNKGTYGGKRFFKEETVSFFTKSIHGNHRGLGFDKKQTGTKACSPKASRATYGHRGFTGTVVWVDPEADLIYIFLSNRINPSVNNRKMFKKRIRERVHTVIYDAMDSYENNLPFENADADILANLNL